LQVIDSNITAVLARFIHFVDIENDLNDSQTAILSQLLSYGSLQSSADIIGKFYWSLPRSGTISPWSSKATEIAQRCGLSAVKRIERGIEYSLMANKPVSTTVKIQLSTLLHDRMTQTVLYDNAEPDLFTQHQPKPLLNIRVIEQGREALVKANSQLGMALSDDEIDYLTDSFSKTW